MEEGVDRVLRDRDEFAALPGDSIFEQRGVGEQGAIVVVRPDQYVAAVLPLDATDELGQFFAALRDGR